LLITLLSGCTLTPEQLASFEAKDAEREASTNWRPYQENAAQYMDCMPYEIRTWNREWGPNGEIYSASCHGVSYQCIRGKSCRSL
jgi:hypothetical protein